jgi:hypothetical protein
MAAMNDNTVSEHPISERFYLSNGPFKVKPDFDNRSFDIRTSKLDGFIYKENILCIYKMV